MPYVVTRITPRKKEVDLLDFLNGLVTMDMMAPPTKLQTTGTRCFYYDEIEPRKLEELNIPKQIEALENFYNHYKTLDVSNGNLEYNYELQIELLRKYKQEFRAAAEQGQAIAGTEEEYAKAKTIEELSKAGLKYNPNYQTFFIPKAKSKPGHTKWRRIDAPEDELMQCLSTLKGIFEVLMDGCYYHTSAYAYVNNRCAKDAAERHAKNRSNWFLKTDFSNFFGNTTPDFVMKMFSEVYPFSEIVKIPRGKTALKNCLNLCFLNGGLPQGTPMSPIITNIMMIPIDHKLSNGLKNKTVVSPNGHESSFLYTRYADDIQVSNRIKFDHREIVSAINATLEYYEAPFRLNNEKTRFGSNAGENWMLGVMVNQDHHVTVGHKRKKRLKATLASYVLDRKNGDMWSLEDIQQLQGEISYCKSVEKEAIDKIINEYSIKFETDIRAAIKADIKTAQ